MDKTDISDFKVLFIDTARKHLETMRDSLVLLQKNPVDADAMNNIYIASHSLKGESLAMGHMTNAAVAQLIEKIYHAAKEGTLLLSPQLLVSTQQAVVKLSESVDSIEKEDKECVLSDERVSLEKASGISLN